MSTSRIAIPCRGFTAQLAFPAGILLLAGVLQVRARSDCSGTFGGSDWATHLSRWLDMYHLRRWNC